MTIRSWLQQKREEINKNKRLFLFLALPVVLVASASVLYIFPFFSKAAEGDFAIYREATGNETITSTASDQAWDTTVTEGTGFSIDAGRTDITLSDEGHYLVMYNLGLAVTSGSTEAENQGYIDLAGTDLAYGRASCHITKANLADECWLSGAAIIETGGASEVLTVEAQRTDNGAAVVRRRAGESGVTILRLDDIWDYARIQEAGGGQAFNSRTFTTVTWDTNDELDSGSFSRSGGDITLVQDGHYLVTVNVMLHSSTNQRRSNGMRLTLDGYELPGTRTTSMVTGNNSSQDHVASYMGIIEATSSNQVLNVQIACDGETCSSISNTGGQTAISIAKLPDTAKFIRLIENGGTQAVDGTNDPITWDTQEEIDTTFSHDTGTNPSRVTVDEDGDYLFFGSFYADRTNGASSGQRQSPHWEWRLNGSTENRGSFGRVNEGTSGSHNATTSGNAGGIIWSGLSANDYVELANTDEANGTDSANTFVSDRQAIQGVRIDTLIEEDVVVSAVGSQVATTTVPGNDVHIGGAFSLKPTRSTETITDITITASGTIDLQNDVDDIRLFYELDTTGDIDCEAESFTSTTTETQFGSTDSDGFSANGTSTFSGSVAVTSSQSMCVYVIVDIPDTAVDGETLEIRIPDPTTEVVISSGNVDPEFEVDLGGFTTLRESRLTQIHYHWRNDDGDEGDTVSGATSFTGGTEDTPILAIQPGTNKRLRLQVSNEGTLTASSSRFRLEYAPAIVTCSAATGWTDVGAVGGDWDMSASANITDGNNTTNISSTTRGAITDENTTFLTSNGGLKDTSSQITGIVLASTTFAELEYSVEPTGSATPGATYCFRVTEAGTPIRAYDVYPQATIAADVLVSTQGSQEVGLDKGTTDVHIGGAFAIQEQAGGRDIEEITITASGTIDIQNHIDNIRLYYDLDTTAPYDCASESFDGVGVDSQYGSTDSDGFSAAGTSTFTQTQGITTTQNMCVYVIVDIDAAADNGETFDVEISDPGTDVVRTGGTIAPDVAVRLPIISTINGPVLVQSHYHWRYDDGTESGATSATNGNEDTVYTNAVKGSTIRLRFAVDNNGIASSSAAQFRLEFAPLVSTCSAIGTWTDVGATGGAWDPSDSNNLTDGDDTTNIAVSTGGVTDVDPTFLTPNSAVKDSSSQTSSIEVGPNNFLEIEYAIEATDSAADSTTYCFRLTDDGTVLDNYSVYPQATTRANQDFFIQRATTTISSGATSTTITAGVDYIAPTNVNQAFIRITGSQHTGGGRTSGGNNQNSDDVMVFIANPENLLDSITFERFGQSNNTFFSWEIVEYIGPIGAGNEMAVRDTGVITMDIGDISSSTQTIAGILDYEDVVVFVTGVGNADTGRSAYHASQVTASWASTTDQAEILRGVTTADIEVSYAVVEFVGEHWNVQRIEHAYSGVNPEDETLPETVDRTKTFIHAQKRITNAAEDDLEEHGHEVYLNSDSNLRFQLDLADNPSDHDAVAWVIENQQTTGDYMEVHRTNGNLAGGGTPLNDLVSIGATITALDNASIFLNNRVNGTGNGHPRSMIIYHLISTTTYEVWTSEGSQTRRYRTEVVEWPTAAREIIQNYYHFYFDNDLLDPTDGWPEGVPDIGENTVITALDDPVGTNQIVRIRMSLMLSDGSLSANSKQFKLQYGERTTTCTAISEWLDVGEIGSTTTMWRGVNVTPVDGTSLSTNPPTGGDLNISIADRAGTYEEENPTPLNPYKVALGEDVEFDWVVSRALAPDTTSYCFRMTESDGTLLSRYDFYPTAVTAGFEIHSEDWKWFDDEENETPSTALAATNTAPSNVALSSIMKLRMVLVETAGSNGDAKFKLQFSETSDFSSGIYDVVDQDECTSGSLWCYADGAGEDHATITTRILSTADSCSGSTGDGCGTHNEYSYVKQVLGEVGTSTTDSTGATINLTHTYTDPVFIVEAISGNQGGPATDPAAVFITATTTSSFDVRIQEPDNEDGTHGNESFAWIVMERGAHTLPDGTRIDVGSLSTNDYVGNGVGGGSSYDTCTFTQSFTQAPVVLTALQTNYNSIPPDTEDFFTALSNTITASQFSCAIEVPDSSTNAPSNNETIGWIAITPGTIKNNGIAMEIATTSVSVEGWIDTTYSNWYQQTFTQTFAAAPGVIATKRTRNGADGGWVRHDVISTTSMRLAIDEGDGTIRSHTAESVGYLAFDRGGTLFDDGTATSTLKANSAAEFEWTITHHDARAGASYFFRAYDVDRDIAVAASTTYPSLLIENGSLTFIVSGISSGQTTEGITTDVTTTPVTIPFTSVTSGVENEAAHRLEVTTNATEGYQILLREDQNLISSNSEIPGVAASNTSPVAWSTGCPIPSVTGCWGYHAGDNTLSGGSTRFLANDTYAEVSSNPEEIAYSSVPVTSEQTDIVYKLEISSLQPAGAYQSGLHYIVVPVF